MNNNFNFLLKQVSRIMLEFIMLTATCESNISNVIAEEHCLQYRLPGQFGKYAQAFQYAQMLSKGL